MRAEQVFISAGRVRPIWRFFLATLLIAFAHVAVAVVLGMALNLLGQQPIDILFWASLLLFITLLAIFKFLTAVFDGKPLASMGFAFRGRWMQEMALGLIVGAAMIGAIVGLEWVLRLAKFSRNPIAPHLVLAGGVYYGVLFLLAAATEEMTFRGYAFQRLVEAIGPGGGVAVLSVAFGLIHLANPSHTALSTANTMLIGVPLAIAYLRTRSLWLPLGIHFAWNFILGFGFGLPVSGIVFSNTVLRAEVVGFAHLTGSEYGPEGSLLATCIIMLGTIYLLLSRRVFISAEMRALALDSPAMAPGTPPAGESAPANSSDSAKPGMSGII